MGLEWGNTSLSIDQIWDILNQGIEWMEKASEENRKKFFDTYLQNREFLKNVIKNTNIYNEEIMKMFWDFWILKAWFNQEVNEDLYWVDNMDSFLNSIELKIKENIRSKIDVAKINLDNLELLQKMPIW